MLLRLILLILIFPFLTSVLGNVQVKKIKGITYHTIKTNHRQIRILLHDEKGKKLRTFPKAYHYLRRKKLEVVGLMNGGIFEIGGTPSGLLIQDRKTLRFVNRKSGKGNFFLKPNGIFIINPYKAMVINTKDFISIDKNILYAVQSGPLLLSNGKIHPKFKPKSKYRLHRNGVGILKNGEVLFAMTDFDSTKFPNLYDFALFFKNQSCSDALFLDGDLCQMHTGRMLSKNSNHFASIIAVIKE